MTQHEVNETTKSLVAYFTKRDVVLYALGIGCCCDNGYVDDAEESNRHDERELKYAYERHTEFEVFPLYLLALFFIAVKRRDDKTTNNTNNTTTPPSFGIRQFPPESMINRFDDWTSRVVVSCRNDATETRRMRSKYKT